MLKRKSNSISRTAVFMLLFMLGLTSTALGQLSSGVPANFGVEADLYADTIEYDFGLLGGGHGTDDWFNNRDGAGFNGIGVIDTSGWAAFRAQILPGGAAANVTFVRRMAYSYASVVNGYLLLDAVYARDNHSRGGQLDSTMFAERDKNIDNPLTWDLGIGNVPNKNDIIDAYAHIRRDGDQPTDDLWLLTAMSTNVSNGDAHNDMEVFRTLDTLASGSDMFNAPDSGHTAWKVVSGVVEPGDIIFSVDFENGGINPLPSIRIWIRDGDQAAISAANPSIQFSGVFGGGGDDAGPFGYAELVVPAGAAYARSNGIVGDPVDSTLAAPWGHLEGPGADFHDYVLKLQLAETGLNLTALGLDPGTNGDPCVNLFGYVMFKTRSSQSFTASLKDYVGPFAFGQIIDVGCEITPPSQDICLGFDATFTSTATGGIGTLSYCWQQEPYSGGCISTTDQLVITSATESDEGWYRVIVTDEVGCADTCFAELILNDPPVCSLGDEEECEGFDATFSAGATGGTGPYTNGSHKQPYTGDCLGTGSSFTTNNVTESDEANYRVIVTDEKGCADTCFAYLTVNENPSCIVSPPDADICDGELQEFCVIPSGGIAPYTYDWSTGSADSCITVSPPPGSYNYQVVVTDVEGCTTSCEATLRVHEVPICTIDPDSVLLCAGESQQFCVIPSGGTAPYTYRWSTESTDSCITVNPPAGSYTYSVQVTDAHGCVTRCEARLIIEPCGCTFTMGGWGAPCPESQQDDRYSTQPGCIRDHYFSQVFPQGVWIGDPTDTPDGWYRALWEDSSNVESFLPPQHSSGGPGYLAQNWVNPETTTAHVLAGQILALRLNVEFTCAGIFDSVGLIPGEYCYGSFIIGSDCGRDRFTGMTVDSFLTIADSAVGGQLQVLDRYGATLSDVNKTADCLNRLFDGCDPTVGWWTAGAGAKPSSDQAGTLPKEFSLLQNYPNPFNPVCRIDYALPIDCHVRLSVYNILGQRVRVLVDEHQSAAYRSVTWDGKDSQGHELTSGVYFYRIEAGNFTQSKKMILLK